jgi:hypothetical protein
MKIQDKLVTKLSINPDKIRGEQPDLVGNIVIGDVDYRIALWRKETIDGQREYYTGNVSRDGDKNAPKFKLKLYEFRKNSVDDPDLHSPKLCEIAEHKLFAYLWFRQTPPGAIEEFDITLEFSAERRPQKFAAEASLYQKHLRRRFGRPAATAIAEENEPDLDLTEPDDIP